MNEKIDTYCDCCDKQAFGSKEDLKVSGWGFGNGSEFCPDCND